MKHGSVLRASDSTSACSLAPVRSEALASAAALERLLAKFLIGTMVGNRSTRGDTIANTFESSNTTLWGSITGSGLDGLAGWDHR
jgi:hypothetical protein